MRWVTSRRRGCWVQWRLQRRDICHSTCLQLLSHLLFSPVLWHLVRVQNISTFLKLKRGNWNNNILSFHLSLREQQFLYSSSIAFLAYCFLVNTSNSINLELEANNVTMCLWIGCICHWTNLLSQIVVFGTLVPWSFGWSCVSHMIPSLHCFLTTKIMLSAQSLLNFAEVFNMAFLIGGWWLESK